ncbi:MAG TPA: LLM class F420-dependent oxidoreductase [Acidimicrobiia bacterium]|nr:LLM class F420-dependent oxidoreductase [Acidimicrobiia bacterium]
MKFGLMFANAGPFSEPENAVGLAKLAEDLGFESVWTVEHVVVPSGYQSAYPYSPDGRMPGGEDVPIPDPLIWLAYVGAATTSLRLATGILILPQRNPVILAKELATLDRLTSGRLELGVGVGWLEEEFDALGVPFEDRGPRTDEYVDVLRRLWREPETAYDGRFTRFAALKSFPKPSTAGGPPIHIGGHTKAAARRAGRIGDGFFPGRAGDELTALLAEMHKAAVDAGRAPEEIEITSGGALDLDAVKKAADLGVARYIVPPLGFDLETLRTNLGKFAENVMAHASPS